MVPGARLCENGRFYRDGPRAPYTSACNIDIGGAGVAHLNAVWAMVVIFARNGPFIRRRHGYQGRGGLAMPVAGLCKVVVIFARNGMEFV